MPWDGDIGRLRMARTMDERSTILGDRFKAKVYTDLKNYKGNGIFNSWETKEIGELGLNLQPNETRDIWTKAYCSLS